ncbi:YusG family protein [Bacillus sp. REN3]|uniref:YusG family protein n=1 Tax=Bacillus sp. REN3 TaxID=2802440 RepID=UPI001AEDF381|nr:YusG family protein [Bacillus sp. REN3]
MTLKQQKLDVTERVTGKLEKGGIQLYLENEPIGKISLPEGTQLDLEHHFESQQNRIYQHISIPDQSEPRYTDCDEGGWC